MGPTYALHAHLPRLIQPICSVHHKINSFALTAIDTKDHLGFIARDRVLSCWLSCSKKWRVLPSCRLKIPNSFGLSLTRNASGLRYSSFVQLINQQKYNRLRWWLLSRNTHSAMIAKNYLLRMTGQVSFRLGSMLSIKEHFWLWNRIYQGRSGFRKH